LEKERGNETIVSDVMKKKQYRKKNKIEVNETRVMTPKLKKSGQNIIWTLF